MDQALLSASLCPEVAKTGIGSSKGNHMAFADMYELLDLQVRQAKPILNVFHLERLDPGADATKIALAYDFTVLPNLTGLQSTGADHTTIQVRNLSDPTDFAAITPTSGSGTRAGEALSTFNALAIQFTRTRLDIRNGQKRFDVGVETDKVANTWSGPFITLADALAVLIVSSWETAAEPGVAQCRFVILKRVCTVQPPPTPCPSYRLPENDAELLFYHPTQFTSRPRARSQTSRKVL